MSVRWDAVNARARGLSSHLLPRATLERLALAPSLGALAAGIAEAGLGPAPGGAPDPAELELGARREVARRLHILARWIGPRSSVLAVVFDEEDRRSIRALVRGAAAGAPASARLTGLIPTPTLPEKALEDLAHRGNPREIATILALWSHPFGAALLAATDPEHPDLVQMELALHREFAARATRGARSGGSALRAYVRETIDLLNVEAALLLAGDRHEIPLDLSFAPGGMVLSKDAFLDAATAGGTPQAAGLLAPFFAGTGLEESLRHAGQHPETLERAVLARRLKTWRARARSAPLSAAPVLYYLLRLRSQLLQLRDLIWATALGVPSAARINRLIEA